MLGLPAARDSKLAVLPAARPVLQAALGTGNPKHWQQGPDTLLVFFTVALPTFLWGNGRMLYRAAV